MWKGLRSSADIAMENAHKLKVENILKKREILQKPSHSRVWFRGSDECDHDSLAMASLEKCDEKDGYWHVECLHCQKAWCVNSSKEYPCFICNDIVPVSKLIFCKPDKDYPEDPVAYCHGDCMERAAQAEIEAREDAK